MAIGHFLSDALTHPLQAFSDPHRLSHRNVQYCDPCEMQYSCEMQ